MGFNAYSAKAENKRASINYDKEQGDR
jgi:hypothetical protein